MKKLNLKTWGCDTKDCHYRQDFEPTIENMALNGFLGTNCPSCKVGGMKKVTKAADKIKVTHDEDSDIDALDVPAKEKKELKAKRDIEMAKLVDHLE